MHTYRKTRDLLIDLSSRGSPVYLVIMYLSAHRSIVRQSIVQKDPGISMFNEILAYYECCRFKIELNRTLKDEEDYSQNTRTREPKADCGPTVVFSDSRYLIKKCFFLLIYIYRLKSKLCTNEH